MPRPETKREGDARMALFAWRKGSYGLKDLWWRWPTWLAKREATRARRRNAKKEAREG